MSDSICERCQSVQHATGSQVTQTAYDVAARRWGDVSLVSVIVTICLAIIAPGSWMMAGTGLLSVLCGCVWLRKNAYAQGRRDSITDVTFPIDRGDQS